MQVISARSEKLLVHLALAVFIIPIGSSEIGPGNVILGPNPSAHSPSRGAFTITTVANSTGPAL